MSFELLRGGCVRSGGLRGLCLNIKSGGFDFDFSRRELPSMPIDSNRGLVDCMFSVQFTSLARAAVLMGIVQLALTIERIRF